MGLISIVIPVEFRVHKLVLQTRQLENLASKIAGHDFEFIFVNDGSHPHSLGILKTKADNDKRFRIITLTREFGLTALFLAGIAYASGDCAAYFPGWNLDPCQVFTELIRHWEANVKVVIGKWEQPYIKPTKSRAALTIGSFIRGKYFSGYKNFEDISSLILDKEVFYIMSQITGPKIDILEFLAWTGFESHLIEYSLQEREGDGKKLTFRDRKLMLGYPQDISSPKALQTSLSVGLFLAILGTLIIIGLNIASGYYQRFLPEWWMIVGLIVFIFGVQLVLMGISGEWLLRSLEKYHSQPVFVVDSVINAPVSASIESREKLEKMILSLWSIRKQKDDYSASISKPPSEDEPEE